MGLDIYDQDIDTYVQDLADAAQYYMAAGPHERFCNLIESNQQDWYEQAKAILLDPNNIKYSQDDIDKHGQELVEKSAKQSQFVECVRYLDRLRRYDSLLVTPPQEYIDLANQYQYILEEDDVQESRMGSYSMIHYGRQYAYHVGEKLDELGLDPHDPETRISPEDVIAIVRDMRGERLTGYADCINPYFPQFLHHSDCDGTYLPALEGYDPQEGEGSSLLLLKELDLLYRLGAIQPLQEYIANMNAEYKDVDVFAPKEVSNLYNYVANVDWVWRKMMKHAVISTVEQTIIDFS